MIVAPATVCGLALVGAGIASAHGLFGGVTATPAQVATRQETSFQNEASLLGVSEDTVKAAWASGESMQALMKANNITQAEVTAKLQAQRQQNEQTRIQDLVSQGVITQAQATQRLAFLQTQAANAAKNPHGGFGGFGGGMRGGFGGHKAPGSTPAPTPAPAS